MMAQRRGWTLRQQVIALLVVVGSVLAIIAGAAAVVAAQNRAQINVLLDKTGPLRTDGEELLAVLVNQENGVRGFAASGDPGELEQYESGVRQEQEILDRMARRLKDDPKILSQLQVVRAQAIDWRATVADPLIQATASGGTTTGKDLLTKLAGQPDGQRFDQLRGSVDALQESIRELRNRAADDIRSSGNILVMLLVVAVVVVVLAGFLLIAFLNRLFIHPITAFAAEVREIAKGDYDRDLPSAGAPELAQLAADVDAMRHRIASDLAEVREARSRIEWVNSQLQKQAEELVRSNRDLEQFAYVASHDLQEPLRKVASFCQLLQRRYAGQLDERADQYIAFAVDGAQRMQRLINDLLAFSRIGRLTTGFDEVDLNKVMGDVAGQSEAARQHSGGELTWSDLPVIYGEEPLLTNLFANLVSNSLKFWRPDVPPRVHISARQVGDEWEITCQDNGIGIEPEFADKIFVIFQRLHSKDAYPGTGIGLAIVKKIVEYHGGHVWVDTDVPEGTAIRFTLPVLTKPSTEAADQPEDTPESEPDSGSELTPGEVTESLVVETPAQRDGDAETVQPERSETPDRPIAVNAPDRLGHDATAGPGDGAGESRGGVKETVV